MPGPGCISEADLRAYVLAELPERISQAIAAHLEACAECEAAARRLDGLTDPVICSLRQALRPAGKGNETAALSPAEARKSNSTPDCSPSAGPSLCLKRWQITRSWRRWAAAA
jgi:anti-sigma factor RsiW